MSRLIILLLVLAIGVGAYFALREGGWLERVTEARVEAALLEAGVPEDLAGCMAPRLVEKLSIIQLRKLERLGPQEGEAVIPLSPFEALDRLRRVDDPEAVRALVASGTRCGAESLLGNLGS